MQINLKEMEDILEKLEEKVDWTNGIKETISKNNYNKKNAISLEPLEKEINNINEKVKWLKENAMIEMDEEVSVIYELLKKKAKPSGEKIFSKEDKEIEEKIEKVREDIDNILEAFKKRIK